MTPKNALLLLDLDLFGGNLLGGIRHVDRGHRFGNMEIAAR